MPTVAGIFESPIQASKSVIELVELHIDQKELSLLIAEGAREKYAVRPVEDANSNLDPQLTGGLLGLLIEELTPIKDIPVLDGTLFASGPFVKLATDASPNHAPGGLAGLLIRCELERSEVDRCIEAIKANKAVILAHAVTDLERNHARSILTEMATAIHAA